MTTEIKHPRALAIAQKGESAKWDMGDYLLEVAGKPKGDTTNDGSMKAIKEVSDELIGHGFPDYSIPFMSQLRYVSHAFGASDRVRGVSWTAHQVAGSPELLQATIAAAKEQGRDVGGRRAGEGISKRFVRQVIDGLDADQKVKRKGLSIRAQKAADRAEAKGDKAAAERHKERARKLKGAPKPDKSKRKVPSPAEVPMVVAKAKFAADSTDVRMTIKRMDKEISPFIDDLTKAFVVGSVEELLEIADLCRKLAAKLNRNQSNPRAHLHAVA